MCLCFVKVFQEAQTKFTKKKQTLSCLTIFCVSTESSATSADTRCLIQKWVDIFSQVTLKNSMHTVQVSVSCLMCGSKPLLSENDGNEEGLQSGSLGNES